MNDEKERALKELTRLAAESALIGAEIEAASSIDEQFAIIETRSNPVLAQMKLALDEIRRIDLAMVRERINQSLASTGRGSRLLKAAGREAADTLNRAQNEGAELLEVAQSEAQDLLEVARSEANDILETAQDEAGELHETAKTDADDLGTHFIK